MITEITQKDLDLHAAYLRGESDGIKLVTEIGAVRISANLRGADLRGADLRRADLRRADLSGADLRGADLRRADLRRAAMSGADLSGASLRGANLSCANLSCANLRGANLRGADLSGASLSDADLSYANLSGANLSGADLSYANLSGANLSCANLSNVKHDARTSFFDLQCPEEGEFIAWKKCENNVIVKLRIPAEARRSSATSRKCRAEFVDVLEVFGAEFGISSYDSGVEYHPGQRVTCDTWNEDRWTECGGGIHFFITRGEAEQYEL